MEYGKMGLFSCVALIVGACIGSAIFSISGLTIYYAGASAVLSWVAAAFIFGLYGLVVAALARKFPRSGGIYIFPKRAFGGSRGAFWGFLSGWGYVISNIVAIAFSAIYFGQYLAAEFPALGSPAAISLAGLVVALCIVLSGNRSSRLIQNGLAVLLTAALLLYCITAFSGGEFYWSHFRGFFSGGFKGPGGFVSAIPLAMLAYGGCVVVSFLSGEVSNPKRNVRRSLLIGLGAVAALYSLVIVAVVGTLPASAVFNPASRYTPLSATVRVGGLSAFPWMGKVVTIAAALALLSTMTAILRVNAAAVPVMASEGLLPRFFVRRTKQGIARTAIYVMGAVCAVLCFFPSWTDKIISLGAVLNIVSMTVTCVALFVSRNSRKWKFVPLAVAGIMLLCYLPEIVKGDNDLWLYTAAVYAAGLAVYCVCRSRFRQTVSGVVVHGKGQGHTIGIPTANLAPFPGEKMPQFGVWKTSCCIKGRFYDGITNVGLRPSADDNPVPSVETYIKGFSGDLYGEEMTVELIRYLRPTRKFESLDALKEQIHKDLRSI